MAETTLRVNITREASRKILPCRKGIVMSLEKDMAARKAALLELRKKEAAEEAERLRKTAITSQAAEAAQQDRLRQEAKENQDRVMTSEAFLQLGQLENSAEFEEALSYLQRSLAPEVIERRGWNVRATEYPLEYIEEMYSHESGFRNKAVPADFKYSYFKRFTINLQKEVGANKEPRTKEVFQLLFAVEPNEPLGIFIKTGHYETRMVPSDPHGLGGSYTHQEEVWFSYYKQFSSFKDLLDYVADKIAKGERLL